MKSYACVRFLLVYLFVIIHVVDLTAQTVQEQLNSGLHPCTITSHGIPVDSLIGKIYGGGFIFYFDSISCEGLVAAPASQDSLASWGCFLSDLVSVPNVTSPIIPSGLGAELFDGWSNTVGILNDCPVSNIAADVSSGYTGDGFSDWHLPSILELVEMHLTIGQGSNNSAGFEDALYWSSSEQNSGSSWLLEFSQPSTSFALGAKHLNLRVRAIRKIEAPVPPQVFYVDSSATGTNSGDSWVNAFTEIQDAFLSVVGCDSILVAQGTYLPDTSGLIDARTATFYIPDLTIIYGGYPSGGGLRDIINNPSILSGAIDLDPTKHAYHVVTMENLSNKVQLDGFTITNGRADGGGENQSNGGGIIHLANSGGRPSSPNIINCSFVNNSGTSRGGAIYNVAADGHSTCSPMFSKCLFQSNEVLGSNGEGGGMCNDAIGGLCLVTIDSCQFIENLVFKSGGAIHNHANNSGEVSFSIKNTIFHGNIAQTSDGGALSCFHVNGQTTGTFENSQFINNTAYLGGGGISVGITLVGEFINLTLTDCLLEGNSVLDGDGGGIGNFTFGGQTNIELTRTVFKNNNCALSGGGVFLYAADSIAECTSTMTDCVFEGNNAMYGGGVAMLAVDGKVEPTCIQSLFFNNTAHSGGALDIYAEEVMSKINPEILNCTFAKNTTTGSSAITAETISGEVSPMFLNSIIWANQDIVGQAGFVSFNATPIFDFTLVDTTCVGLGDNAVCGDSMIYNVDPNFVSLDTNDFHFNGGSIAANVGQNDSLAAKGILVDLDSDTRIKSGTVDLGVYELSPCPDIISLLNNKQTAGNFHAVLKVESNGIIKLADMGIYKAGVEIYLFEEFEVKLGAVFEASISVCVP